MAGTTVYGTVRACSPRTRGPGVVPSYPVGRTTWYRRSSPPDRNVLSVAPGAAAVPAPQPADGVGPDGAEVVVTAVEVGTGAVCSPSSEQDVATSSRTSPATMRLGGLM